MLQRVDDAEIPMYMSNNKQLREQKRVNER